MSRAAEKLPSTRVRVTQTSRRGWFHIIRLIWTLTAVLFLLWLLGLISHIGGGLIHLLLFLALVGIVYNLLVRRGLL